MMTPTVRLKNGNEEAKVLVVIIMRTLNRLFDEGKGGWILELVTFCRDSEHMLSDYIGEALKYNDLISGNPTNGWYVHGSIRNIVLSAMSGEGLDMTLGNPMVAQTETPPVAGGG